MLDSEQGGHGVAVGSGLHRVLASADGSTASHSVPFLSELQHSKAAPELRMSRLGGFLPPAALAAELSRRSKLLDDATEQHEKAVESLVRDQARLDHARNGAAAKAAARAAAAAKCSDVDTELQVAKYMAEYWASAWERKEGEAAEAAAVLHRAETELRQANSAVEAVRKQTGAVIEAKEDADAHLAAATAAYEKAQKKGSRSRSRGPRSPPANVRVPFGLQRQFEDALLACLEARRPPFNVSFINDRMKRLNPRWNCQADLGCSFSHLCQQMQRNGVLQLLRGSDGTWEVAGSRLQARARPPGGPPPPRRSPPAAADGGDRWVMG
ncbi:Proteasome subunit alpha type-4 [Chlorella sorokiniana]|uniref:Proteasome subunit alpha type-4 n=1 Tax=Chlorella sorokiniana TaxID=3076 RepID=A0A2P6TMP7_CHLSO|nr:Proteasome subunit alpha type-4 [Chlorella sorokiniana]|eukprot:PRW45602.1 Proteasome subunit alpha type-4 [Chlorella sorokiniana]